MGWWQSITEILCSSWTYLIFKLLFHLLLFWWLVRQARDRSGAGQWGKISLKPRWVSVHWTEMQNTLKVEWSVKKQVLVWRGRLEAGHAELSTILNLFFSTTVRTSMNPLSLWTKKIWAKWLKSMNFRIWIFNQIFTTNWTLSVKREINKMNCWLLIRNHGSQTTVGWCLQRAERKGFQPTILCLNPPSEIKEKLRHFQVHKKWENSPANLPHKECWRESFRLWWKVPWAVTQNHMGKVKSTGKSNYIGFMKDSINVFW